MKHKGKFEYRLRWDDAVYEPGEVRVIAYKDGKFWAENSTETAGKAAAMELSTDRTEMRADGKDLVFITVKITDRKGRLVPDASNLVEFSVEGPAMIAATDNGDPTSHESFLNHSIKAFHGLALCIIRPAEEPGTVKVKASCRGMKPVEITLSSCR